MSDYKLGRKVQPPNPDPEPEWQRIAGTPFEKNAKGQKRTCGPLPPPKPTAVDLYIETLAKGNAP